MTGNRHFVSGGFDGNIYVASTDTYDDDGNAILFQRSGPHINQLNKMLRHKRFEVLQEQGVISGAVPNAILEISNNGGRTYGPQLPVAMGDVDDFTKVTRWQRLGACRDRVYRFSRTDANRQAWIDAILETEAGDGG
jgi:hypothetical protein